MRGIYGVQCNRPSANTHGKTAKSDRPTNGEPGGGQNGEGE